MSRLWARRRIAFLLDQARVFDRPPEELVDEVVALGREYRILTPCTSFLFDRALAPGEARALVLEALGGVQRRARVETRTDQRDGLQALEDSESASRCGG